jgi:hypothetical protein
MSKNHIINEDDVSVYEKLKDKHVDVGDTIEYISNNQQGYKKYKVVNELGKKGLKVISSYDDFMGGRRKTRKRSKSKRSKSKRSKSKRSKSKRSKSKRSKSKRSKK